MQFYTGRPEEAILHIPAPADEIEPSPPESPLKRPRPITPPVPEDPKQLVLAVAPSKTCFTPKQVDLAPKVAKLLENLAREHKATILDIRKAYDYWTLGKK